jgi:tetratricopeptide (TPR) repeat protein
VPDLLSGALEGGTAEAALGSPAEITVDSDGWDDIGLGAITDIVQAAYGPVALDRSPVELAVLPDPRQHCPACAGRRFNFPADLNDHAAYMCGPHQKEAQEVTRERLVRAERSNRPGWNAITDACIRQQQLILPFGLASKIRAQIGKPGRELLGLLAQVRENFSGQPEDFYAAIGEKSVRAGRPPRWMQTLVRDLASAGLLADALAAADTLADFEPLWSSRWYDDSLAALAAALPTEAIEQDRVRFQVQFVKDLCPGIASVQMHAGDVYNALGEPESALAAYEKARSLAVEHNDFEVRRAVRSRIAALAGDEAPAQEVIRVQRRVQSRRKRRR